MWMNNALYPNLVYEITLWKVMRWEVFSWITVERIFCYMVG
jgi:hypothetical protein